MWISQCGADCCEKLISIFSLSNTGSEGRRRLCTWPRSTHTEQWQLVYLRSSVAQKGSHADTPPLSAVIVMVKHDFLFDVIYRKTTLLSQTKGDIFVFPLLSEISFHK